MRITVQQALASARGRLAHIDSAALDAELLLAQVLDKPRTWLHAWPDEPVNTEQYVRYQEYLDERNRGVPLAYLTGHQEFWSLSLRVNRHTLVPRPETEVLVEEALGLIPETQTLHIADLGTGTGAIGLALAKERPTSRFLLTDISDAALSVARANAQRHNIDNVSFRQGSWFEPLQGETFDVIVSNPPYVAQDDPHLQSDGVQFEPQTALQSGSQGLDDLNVIVSASTRYLHSGGYLLVEHGYDQQQAVADIFSSAGFRQIRCRRDYADQPRVTLGRWDGLRQD